MRRHPLYDEFEKEGYLFSRALINGRLAPMVRNEADLNDFCIVDFTLIINGRPQIASGPTCTQKTVKMLQRFIEVLSAEGDNFIDYISKDIEESSESI